MTRVFPGSHFGSFYSQNLVLDHQKLEARVLSNIYMINPISILLVFCICPHSICDLKSNNYHFWATVNP